MIKKIKSVISGKGRENADGSSSKGEQAVTIEKGVEVLDNDRI